MNWCFRVLSSFLGVRRLGDRALRGYTMRRRSDIALVFDNFRLIFNSAHDLDILLLQFVDIIKGILRI